MQEALNISGFHYRKQASLDLITTRWYWNQSSEVTDVMYIYPICQSFTSLCDWITIHWLNKPILCITLKLFPPCGYCELCYCEHSYVKLVWSGPYHLINYVPRIGLQKYFEKLPRQFFIVFVFYFSWSILDRVSLWCSG